jgi:hypothetical protein
MSFICDTLETTLIEREYLNREENINSFEVELHSSGLPLRVDQKAQREDRVEIVDSQLSSRLASRIRDDGDLRCRMRDLFRSRVMTCDIPHGLENVEIRQVAMGRILSAEVYE